MTLYIGDVHGYFGRYKTIIKGCKDTIQVGDMGVGFRDSSNPPYDCMVEGNHRFIRGNHDNPSVCKRHTQYIPDGTIEGNTMFIGGAVSVDKNCRLEGRDYWAAEELTQGELEPLIEKYIEVKPEVIVTHDCPEEIAILMCAMSGRKKLDYPSKHRKAFQRMFTAHSPRLWVYGHWHFPWDNVVQGTRFVCLDELEVRDLSI